MLTSPTPIEKSKVRASQRVRYRDKVIYIYTWKAAAGCQNCDEKHIACLEFHHPIPKEKEFHVSANLSWANLKKEILKCIVLCANCHRLAHAEQELQRIADEPGKNLFSDI